MDLIYELYSHAADCDYYNSHQAEFQNSPPSISSPRKIDEDISPRRIKVLKVSHSAAFRNPVIERTNICDTHVNIPSLDQEHIDHVLLEWTRSTVNNQALSLQMSLTRRSFNRTKMMTAANEDAPPVAAVVDDEEPDFELLMLQRLRQTMDRSFLQKMSSCAVLLDHSADELTWFSFLLDACDGAEYVHLVRALGRQLLGLSSLGADHQSSTIQSEEDQVRVACVDGQWVTSDTEALNSICMQLCSGSAAESGLLNDSGRPNHHNLVLEHLIDNLRQRRVDGRPAHFAVEESHSSSSSGSWAKRKQLLVYTLLDLMHKKDLHFLLIGVTAAVDLQLLLEKRVISRMNAQFIHLPGKPTEEAVISFMARSCQLPSPPESLRVGQWKEFVQNFNSKAEKTFLAGTRALLRRVVRAHLQWGCNLTFFRRVLRNAIGALTSQSSYLEKQTIVEAFKQMEPPTLREILIDLTQLELLVYSCAARLGIAAKRDNEIPGLLSLQDLLAELPKLGSWASADLTGYSSGKQRPLSQFYVMAAVRSLLCLGLLSSSEGKALTSASTSGRGLRPLPLHAALHGAAFSAADDDDGASAVNTVRFASGRWQVTESSLPWSSTLIQGPHTLLFLRHSPQQIRQAFSLKNSIDPVSGQVDRQPPLRMTERLRRAVLSPLEPIIGTGSGAGLQSGLGLGLGLADHGTESDVDGHATSSSSRCMPSRLRVATALEDRAL